MNSASKTKKSGRPARGARNDTGHSLKRPLPANARREKETPLDSTPQHITTVLTDHHADVSSAHCRYLDQKTTTHLKFLASRRKLTDLICQAACNINKIDSPEVDNSAGFLPRPNGALPLSFDQLKVFASGNVSEVLGPRFNNLDTWPRRVRLPDVPLLLVDRVTHIEGTPGCMEAGRIRTETDVTADRWYVHDGFISPGMTVEAAQGHLLLLSWLGIDFLNRGERVYRLLGCDFTFHGSPAKAGDTLCYDIHVTGYSQVTGAHIFSLVYDCRVNGELRMSVRNAQAGFFTERELAESKGIIWNPQSAVLDPAARVDPPAIHCTRSAFSSQQVKAFSRGRVFECFGPGFEITQTHTRTPRIPSGRMLRIDRIVGFDPSGGPWKRGYLKAESRIDPDAWFFACHFKNDPCMPGTMMSDAGLQVMAFYLTALGHTRFRDGWRFEPVAERTSHIKCRGQVTPGSKILRYEVFVVEVFTDPRPTVYADIVVDCDGLKILHVHQMGLRLVPDWPPVTVPEATKQRDKKRTVARVGNLVFDHKSLLACAYGRPSDAFGNLGRPFDDGRHISRLPAPPYHFATRVAHTDARMGTLEPGASVVMEYDVPESAWFFDANGHPTIPLCIIMEAGLQPCGWLSMFGGAQSTDQKDLYFRNLDGTGTLTTEVLPHSDLLTTHATLTRINRIPGITLVNFKVECTLAGRQVFTMTTGFGFFLKPALEQQKGLPATEAEKAWLNKPSDFFMDLTRSPDQYFAARPRLPKPMLLMIDRVTGYWPDKMGRGYARLRAEKTVNPGEWFFKAHFFQDPVQPGSLGVESMIQLLQFYMLHEALHAGMAHPRFVPMALDNTLTWKYRGQVTPDKKRITVEMTILDQGKDAQGIYAAAEAWLWADNLRIFHVQGLKVHIIEDAKGSRPATCGPAALVTGSFQAECNAIFSHTRRQMGISAWFGEDFYESLCNCFTRHLILDDPSALEELKGRSALFLGNHQVQIESFVFPNLASAINGRPIVTIADARHLHGWVGELNNLLLNHPGIATPNKAAYFNQTDRQSMFDILAGLRREITQNNVSVFLHAEGKLGLTCRQPVTNLSSVFVDLALETDMPVVPVRFSGGLPIAPLATPLDFPVGYGKQDYHVGKPIFPEQLRALPYAERRNFIVNRINALGPDARLEIPGAANPDLKKKVTAWRKESGASEATAVIFKALETLPDPTHDTRAVLRAIHGYDPEIKNNKNRSWLTRMSAWLGG